MDGVEIVGLDHDEDHVLAEGAVHAEDAYALDAFVMKRTRAATAIRTVGGRVGLLDVEQHSPSIDTREPCGKVDAARLSRDDEPGEWV